MAATPTNSFTSSNSTTCNASIDGLREQIFANATVLFPQLVATSRSFKATRSFDPKETFEIITTTSNATYKAILVTGTPAVRRAVARGALADCVTGALDSLLKVTGEALGWYTDTLLGDLENAEATESGVVDVKMVEDGFHFAHVERWVQAQGHKTGI